LSCLVLVRVLVLVLSCLALSYCVLRARLNFFFFRRKTCGHRTTRCNQGFFSLVLPSRNMFDSLFLKRDSLVEGSEDKIITNRDNCKENRRQNKARPGKARKGKARQGVAGQKTKETGPTFLSFDSSPIRLEIHLTT
jgi:hypothetical protein